MFILISTFYMVLFVLNQYHNLSTYSEERPIYPLIPYEYPKKEIDKPNTEVCHIKKDLFDGSKYLKSLCITVGSYTYEESSEECTDNNMNAFIIDNFEVETQFHDAATYFLKAHRRGVLWINGKKRSDGQWKVFNEDQTVNGSLYHELTWNNRQASGDCLTFSSLGGSYQAQPSSCDDDHLGACEYYYQTEDPPALDVSKCHNKKDLYVDGTYVKSMCIIVTMDTYDEGRQRCARHGMNLFIIDSTELGQTFSESLTEFLSVFPNGHVWVNGRFFTNISKWMVFNPNRSTKGFLRADLNWTENGKWSAGNLRYSGQNGPYMANGYPGSSEHSIVCEYYE